jgi:tetratricopeptide (TPR) repeat protein
MRAGAWAHLVAAIALASCATVARAQGVPPGARVHVDSSIKGTAAEARLLIHARQRGEADTLAQRLLVEAERRHGPESLEAADALDLLVEALDIFYWFPRPERLERARPLVARALAIKEAKLGAEDPRLAPSLDHAAMVAWLDGDTTRARSAAERARAIRAKAYGTEHVEYAKSLQLLGRIAERSGDAATARELFENALGIQERRLAPDDLEIAETLALLQHFGYTSGGQAREGVAIMRRMLPILESRLGPGQSYTLYWMRELGQNLVRVDPEEGKALLDRALALGETSLGPRHPLVARTYADLLEYHLIRLDPAVARPFVDLAVSRYPEDTYLLLGASVLYEFLGDYPRALETATAAVNAYERGSNREARTAISVLGNRGYYAMLVGDYLAAEKDLMRTLEVCDSLPEPQDLSDALLRDAWIYCIDGIGYRAERRGS